MLGLHLSCASEIDPHVKEAHCNHYQKQKLLHGDQAIEKGSQYFGKLFFLKIERDNGNSLEKVYHHDDYQAIDTKHLDARMTEQEQAPLSNGDPNQRLRRLPLV